MIKSENAKISLSSLKESFEAKLKFEVSQFDQTILGEACKYSLLTGGKRLRPIIVYLMSLALNSKEDVFKAAVSLEYFHTASLIADDMPCMDNDDFRRDHLTNHKKFGEATALLASYALIVEAFEKIYQAQEASTLVDKERRGLIALKEVSFAAGMFGATGGQFLDLFSKKGCLNDFSKIIERKTVRLFEVSFLMGWIFAGGDLAVLETVRQLGYHFGFAFQLADDLQDLAQDRFKEKQANFALYLGEENAQALFSSHTQAYFDQLDKLKVDKEGLVALGKRLCQKN